MVSQIRGTISGVPRTRTVAFWGLYWCPPYLGNYHISKRELNLSYHDGYIQQLEWFPRYSSLN